MTTTPGDLATELAAGVVNLYADAEAVLIDKMAIHVAKGIDAPDWEQKQLIEVQKFRKDAQAVLDNLATQSGSTIKANMLKAAESGQRNAIGELTKSMTKGKALIFDTHSVSALSSETTAKLKSTHFPVLRTAEDAYRDVIARAVIAPTLGAETREQAAQRALNEFAKRGITGFTDARGRKWSMSSYTEMALRASLANAQLQGHATQLEAIGVNLIIVSDHAQECKLCRPFEGKVLSMKDDGKHMPLAEARGAGLFHPGCRHSFSAYYPGKTKTFGNTADPQGDQDRQKLRYLERKVREQRRLEAAALDPAAKKAAANRAKAYQAQIKQHVATTSAVRQPKRERISGVFGSGDTNGVGLPKLPTPAKGKDLNPYGKTQLSGSFAPKVNYTNITPESPPVVPAVSKYIETPKVPSIVVNPLTGNTINNPAKLKKLKTHIENGGTLDGFFQLEASKKATQKAALSAKKAVGQTAKLPPKVNASSLKPPSQSPAVKKAIAKKTSAAKKQALQGAAQFSPGKSLGELYYEKQTGSSGWKYASDFEKDKYESQALDLGFTKADLIKEIAEKKAAQEAKLKAANAAKPNVPSVEDIQKAWAAKAKSSAPKPPDIKTAPAKKGTASVPDSKAPSGSSGNPVRHTSAAAAKKYAATLNENDVTKWPKKLGAAVQRYTGSSYTTMNGWARAGGVGRKPQMIDELDEAFNHPEPLKEWMLTTRGTDGRQFGLPAKASYEDLRALVGTEKVEKGYTSTSVTNKPAFGGYVQMIVRNPPGSRGIFVDGAPGQRSSTKLTVNPGENEFLLPRNMKYRIVAVEKGTNGFAHNVIVEVLL